MVDWICENSSTSRRVIEPAARLVREEIKKIKDVIPASNNPKT